jgi:HEPN domain-containing protein
LAARVLFNNDQLYRAIILANTSIEKYFKVYLEMQGKSAKTHNVTDLFEYCKKFDPTLETKINNEFIELISESYHMRYFDNNIFSNDTKQFHISVCKRKTLAELDETIHFIENSWTLRKNQEVLLRRYHTEARERQTILTENNFILNGISKKDFIEGKDLVYEVFSSKKDGVTEVIYIAEEIKDDGKFLSVTSKML